MKNYFVKLKEKDTDGRIFTLFILIGGILAAVGLLQIVLSAFIIQPRNLINSSIFHKDFKDSFNDFFNVNYFVSNNDPYVTGGSSYPPLPLLIAKIFSLAGDYPSAASMRKSIGGIISLTVFFLIFIVSCWLLLRYYLKKKSIGLKLSACIYAIFFLSMPILFTIERANYIFITFIFCALFLLFYKHDKKIVRELAYISLGAAVGMKLYPAAFAIILLKEKKIFPLIRCAFYSVVLLILPFAFFGGFSVVPDFLKNLNKFLNTPAENTGYALSNNYSLTTIIQMLYIAFTGFNSAYTPVGVVTFSKYFSFIIPILVFVCGLMSDKKWKIVMLSCLCMILYPSPSYIYVGIFTVLPFLAFLFEKGKTKKDYFYLTLFILCVAPLQLGYIIDYDFNVPFKGLATGQVIQAFCYLIFFIALCCDAVASFVKKRRIREKFFKQQEISA